MKKFLLVVFFALVSLTAPNIANAMHITEGFLPKEYSIGWLIAVVPFLLVGMYQIRHLVAKYPERKMLLGLVAAFIFVLSALKIPSVAGSSSHATGVGLSAIFFGPAISSVLSGIVLLFQALLLAHGGITTWGANTFSMGVAGAIVAWGVYRACRMAGLSDKVTVFLAAMLGDWMTYVVTAGQLSLAFPDPVGGIWAASAKFLGIFAVTQLPLAVSEGILSVIVYQALMRYSEQGLIKLWWKEGSKS